MVVSWKSQLAPEATLPATNVLTLLKISLDRLDKNAPSEPIPRSPTPRTPPPPSDDHTQSTNTPFGTTAPLRLRPAAAAAGSGRSEHWRRSNPPLAHSAKAPPCPKLPCARRPGSAEPKKYSGAGSGRSEHWKRSNPSLAHSAKAPSCPKLTCARRLGPAEPLQRQTKSIECPLLCK
jgi:hypothetical protein